MVVTVRRIRFGIGKAEGGGGSIRFVAFTWQYGNGGSLRFGALHVVRAIDVRKCVLSKVLFG